MAEELTPMQQRRHGHVTWLTFDHPERLNSFTADDYHEIGIAIDEAVGDPNARIIVVTGQGRAFSAGAHRSLLDRGATSSPSERERAGKEFLGFLAALRECAKPIVAAVNGLAVGVGCTMLMYFDLVLAAESARFRLPFTSLGIVPEAGSSVLLPARARWDQTMWAMLSSQWIDAREACEMGMVWRVVPDADLVSEAARVAATIAAHDPAAVKATKRLLTTGRSDAARLAIEREFAEMAGLFDGKT
jgi:enoyl-CoA hydratase/carnithine racemase